MLSLLTFIGRNASRALPIGVLIGLFFPLLSANLKPFLVPALLVPLTLSLVRIQTPQLLASLKRWRLLALVSIWVLVISPAIVWFVLQLVQAPDSIEMAAVVAATAPPVTACAAISLFLGLDAAIVVVITVITMLFVPLTMPMLTLYMAGLQVHVELWQLSLRLAGFVVFAFLLSSVLKRILGQRSQRQFIPALDGISVIFITIFIIGVMNGVTDLFFERPWFIFLVLVVSTLLVLGLYIVSTLLFWRMGPHTAMAIGLISGNCNLGLMYLVLVDQVSLDLLSFFAIGQIPMYFLPALCQPLIKRLIAR